MLMIEHSPNFISLLKKIKNKSELERIKKQIHKVIENPEVGKLMRYSRKGTREIYIGSFRLSYFYSLEEGKIIFFRYLS